MCIRKNYIYGLDIACGLAVIVCLYLTFTSESLDITSIVINGVLFAIVFWIFFKAKKAMLKILTYAYFQNIYSSRKIETSCRRDINFMWLLAGQKAPDHGTIARFRTWKRET